MNLNFIKKNIYLVKIITIISISISILISCAENSIDPIGQSKSNVEITVNGMGSVTSLPAGINCGTDCSADFDKNTSVSLSATANNGNQFIGWAGDCSGTGSCIISMEENRSVTATFSSLNASQSNIAVSVVGTGSVSSSPSGISCGTNCSANFDKNTNLSLTATAGNGYQFAGWSGDCNGSSSCSVSMAQNRSVTASFSLVGNPQPNILIENYSPAGNAFELDNVNDNASGIIWHESLQQYLVVENNAAKIYRYDINFNYQGKLRVNGIDDDTEGLAYIGNNKVMIVSEDGYASKLEINSNVTNISGALPTSQRYRIIENGGNKGLEGIAARKATATTPVRIYACNEKKPMRVVYFDMPNPDPGFLLNYTNNLNVYEPWDAEVVFDDVAKDLAGMVYDERTGHLIILSEDSSKAMQVNPDTGEIISELNLSGAPQFEGVTLGPNGELVFVSEPNYIRIYTLN